MVFARLIIALWAALFFWPLWAAAAPPEELISAEEGERIFARLNAMRRTIEEILGMRARVPIPRSLISREEINALLLERLQEETDPAEIEQEELLLRLFGFVPDDFRLAEEVADVMTEQATALYDYETKKLYLATWTPRDMQEYALAHELAHAIADQSFDLAKFVEKGESADGDLARTAVIEGQASWVMTEYVLRQGGRSMIDEPLLAVQSAAASRFEVENYPVYSAAPLYLRETMLFPYTAGLRFQQAVVEEFGADAFQRVFAQPPLSTRHVLEPEAYFADEKPLKPKLPRLRLEGFQRLSRGDIGQLEHQILLQQYLGKETAERIAPGWRGGRYEIWQNDQRSQAVLRYASVWSDPGQAKKFFEAFCQIATAKRRSPEVLERSKRRMSGRDADGGFAIVLDSATVASLEGLPPDAMSSDAVSDILKNEGTE